MKSSPHATTIARATGAPVRDLVVIESIMRTEVFHSTLDWQTQSELEEAARQAHQILRSNRPFFEWSQQIARCTFKEMQLRHQIENAEKAVFRAGVRSDAGSLERANQRLKKASERLEEVKCQIQILSGMLDRLCTALPS